MKLTVPALVSPTPQARGAAQEEHDKHAAETVELLEEIDALLAELCQHPSLARKTA